MQWICQRRGEEVKIRSTGVLIINLDHIVLSKTLQLIRATRVQWNKIVYILLQCALESFCIEKMRNESQNFPTHNINNTPVKILWFTSHFLRKKGFWSCYISLNVGRISFFLRANFRMSMHFYYQMFSENFGGGIGHPGGSISEGGGG